MRHHYETDKETELLANKEDSANDYLSIIRIIFDVKGYRQSCFN